MMKYKYLDDIVGIEIMDTSTVGQEIENFEQQFELKLPKQYKKFMIEYNGGKTNNVYFGEDIDNAEVLIREFLSFSKYITVSRIKYSSFEFWNEEKKEEQESDFDIIMPYKKVILIATDVGDNSILISCEEDDHGAIYYQDHEDREYFKITKLTDSFNEFIEGLKHNTTLPGSLGKKRKIKRAKSSEELAEILEDFRKIDEERNKPIYRELKVECYDK